MDKGFDYYAEYGYSNKTLLEGTGTSWCYFDFDIIIVYGPNWKLMPGGQYYNCIVIGWLFFFKYFECYI